MTEPLVGWNKVNKPEPKLIWATKLDDAYAIEVQRLEDYKAKLVIFDKQSNLVHEEDVTLSFGAKFGPDAGDVAIWQDRCIDVIDNPEKRNTNV